MMNRLTSLTLTAALLAPLAAIDAATSRATADEPSSAQSAAWIAADYVLPAYVNLTAATLLVRPTGAIQGPPVELHVAFYARQGGSPPCAQIRTTLKPGEDRRLTLDISGWADGDYRTEIQCFRHGKGRGEPLVRWLRKQTIPAPDTPAEPIDVRGLTTLFVDDQSIHAQSGLRRAVNPAEPFAVTTGRMGPDRPIQKPVGGIRLESDGSWVVKFTDEEREDRNGASVRHYTARSRDARVWSATEDKPTAPKPRRAKTTLLPRSSATGPNPACAPKLVSGTKAIAPQLKLASGSTRIAPKFRFYDPAADGPVNIQEVRLRHTGMAKDVRWGDLEMPYRAVFPVWEKSPAEHLVLTKQWLLRDKHDYPDGAACDWQDTNDNFMNDFHSPEGRTMFYGQSRMILRHDPFRIPFDAFKSFPGGHYNRIMVTWRSQDGIQWTPTFFDPQREDDPVSYQGYGAQQFYVEGKRLSLCYFFAYRAQLQQVCVELRYSRDNIHWQRLPGRLDDNVFAANGPWGSWNFGYMLGLIGTPLEKDGEMFQLFASCQNVPHHFFRSLLGYDPKVISDPQWLKAHFEGKDIPGYPFWRAMGGSWEAFARQAPQACRPMGGMRYRKDGWVALKPAGQEGELVTKVLLAGEHLEINAKTKPGGHARVELLDAESRPLPDFSGTNAASFTGDSVNTRLVWKKGAQATLPRQPVRLRIKLDQADLFALHWR